jgi:regulator of sirC expression with transglutaminase-like and TPR domain
MNEKDITALISLLDDPDEEIFSHIREKLLSYGSPVIPFLEKEWEKSFESTIQTRIENIIHHIQFSDTFENLKEWVKNGGENLLTGILLVARYQYPDLDEAAIHKQIETIKHDVWLELNPNLTALEKVRVLNHIIFEVHGFSGNTTNFHAPQNSYINNVLESKRGNPLSLSIVYTIIAQALEMPVYGVNLPEHFILAYAIEQTDLPVPITDKDEKVMFYINPFSKGTVFGKSEVDSFLRQLKVKPTPSFYEPCTNIDMIRRVINNLSYAYEKLGYPDKVKDIRRLQKAIFTSSES